MRPIEDIIADKVVASVAADRQLVSRLLMIVSHVAVGNAEAVKPHALRVTERVSDIRKSLRESRG